VSGRILRRTGHNDLTTLAAMQSSETMSLAGVELPAGPPGSSQSRSDVLVAVSPWHVSLAGCLRLSTQVAEETAGAGGAAVAHLIKPSASETRPPDWLGCLRKYQGGDLLCSILDRPGGWLSSRSEVRRLRLLTAQNGLTTARGCVRSMPADGKAAKGRDPLGLRGTFRLHGTRGQTSPASFRPFVSSMAACP
jgi:hypothetical protein